MKHLLPRPPNPTHSDFPPVMPLLSLLCCLPSSPLPLSAEAPGVSLDHFLSLHALRYSYPHSFQCHLKDVQLYISNPELSQEFQTCISTTYSPSPLGCHRLQTQTVHSHPILPFPVFPILAMETVLPVAQAKIFGVTLGFSLSLKPQSPRPVGQLSHQNIERIWLLLPTLISPPWSKSPSVS